MLMLTSFAWHDHLLIFFVVLSGSLFSEFLAEVAAGGRGRTLLLLGGAAALGLGGLSKYSAVFVAVGLIATIALEPRLRRLLRDPRLWLAGAVCLAVLSPVLLWNAENGLASFRFHLVDRHGRFSGVHFRPHGLVHFLVPTILLLSPPLIWAMAAGMRAQPAAGDVFATVYRRLALAVFASSTAVFVGLAIPAWSQYYWNVVAYVLLLPPAALALAERPRLLRAHLGFGLIVATVLVVHATVLPISVFAPSARDDDSREPFGWDAVAAAVNAARREKPVDLLGAADYRPASHLAWALGDPDVAVLSRLHSHFQYWSAPGQRAGASALLVTDHRAPIADLTDRFERVSRVQRIPIVRAGVELKAYELWRAEGLRPVSSP
jgi:4-amino-4-deoxy-L-arabinose transferase-like glycosyltransferase